MNLMQLLVMWTLGSKALAGCKVNLHLRKPENAEVVAASKLRWLAKDECVVASRSLLSTLQVMGIFGWHSLSPMYCLIPCMMCLRNGDSHGKNGRLVSTW